MLPLLRCAVSFAQTCIFGDGYDSFSLIGGKWIKTHELLAHVEDGAYFGNLSPVAIVLFEA